MGRAKPQAAASSSPAPKKRQRGKLPPHLAPKSADFDDDTPLSKKEDDRRGKNRRKPKGTADAHITRVCSKCIRDNFPSFSEVEIHKVLHDGLTMWQTLYRDKQLAHNNDPKAPKFGRLYFDALRSHFGRSCESELTLPDIDEDIDEALFSAVDESRSNPRNAKSSCCIARRALAA